MQNGAMKNAAITLSSCSPAHPGESWTGRFRAMPDQQVSQWPDTTQAAISEIQLWPPCLSSTTSSNKDSNNFSARLAASVENSLLSPISSSDVRCSAKDLSENRKRAHAVWNDTVRSYSRSAGSANEAVYNMQRSRSSAGAEISDLRESLLTSSNEMFSLYKPTVNEGFAFPWSNSVEVLTSSGNSGGFDKQSLHIQRDVWASSSMDRLSNDGKVIRGIDTALSTAPSYCNTSPVNINADNGFRGLRVQTTENARKAELASLLNASNDKFLFEGFNVDSYSNDAFIRLPDQTTSRPISDSLGPGNGTRLVKMDEISSSNNIISSTLSQITPSSSVTFQSSNILTLHGNMNKKDSPLQNKAATVQPLNSAGTVNDSASVSSSSNHRLKSTSQTDEDEEFLTEQIKRKGSAFENGDQAASNHAFKKPRITSGASTLSAPLKVQVRKEKLGERITALQQLVSPFGKTDTASVLLEAIGYIKFLQEQVQVLSAPYLKAANPSTQLQVLQEGREETSYDLRSRGLCLVPVSSTAHVTNDNGADFWTSGIGSGCRS